MLQAYEWFLWGMAALAVVVFIALYHVKAGYGLLRDGRWGPKTWAAIKACSDPKAAALAMVERRRERYAALVRNNPALGKFSRGWENRLKALEKEIRSAS